MISDVADRLCHHVVNPYKQTVWYVHDNRCLLVRLKLSSGLYSFF